jgi:membrane AbrB-like protein
MCDVKRADGADIRLVAFMQYLRVVVVALVATIVARLWATRGVTLRSLSIWFPHVPWPSLMATFVLIVAGAVAGRAQRIPAGAMLTPMVVGTVLQDAGILKIELPPLLLALAYLVLGWSVGLRFSRPILVHAAKAFPRVLASILVLIAICGGLAMLLIAVAHVDPLTAYLATSPGGADSVAIIAASTKVNVPFVMAMQTARFVFVLLTGPAIARLIASRAQKRAIGTPIMPGRDSLTR